MKVTTKETIKDNLFGLWAWFILNTIGVVINYNYALYGCEEGREWLHLTISLLFLIYMIIYAWMSNKTFITILGSLYLILGIVGYIVAKHYLDAGWLILLAFLLFTPYAGLDQLVGHDGGIHIIIACLGMELLLAAGIRYLKENPSVYRQFKARLFKKEVD